MKPISTLKLPCLFNKPCGGLGQLSEVAGAALHWLECTLGTTTAYNLFFHVWPCYCVRVYITSTYNVCVNNWCYCIVYSTITHLRLLCEVLFLWQSLHLFSECLQLLTLHFLLPLQLSLLLGDLQELFLVLWRRLLHHQVEGGELLLESMNIICLWPTCMYTEGT